MKQFDLKGLVLQLFLMPASLVFLLQRSLVFFGVLQDIIVNVTSFMLWKVVGFSWKSIEPQSSQIYSVIDDDNIRSFVIWIFKNL